MLENLTDSIKILRRERLFDLSKSLKGLIELSANFCKMGMAQPDLVLDASG